MDNSSLFGSPKMSGATGVKFAGTNQSLGSPSKQCKQDGADHVARRELGRSVKNMEKLETHLGQRYRRIVEKRKKYGQDREPGSYMMPTLSDINA